MPTTSQLRKKGKERRKVNAEDDAIHEFPITTKDAFELVKSSRSLSFTKEISAEHKKLQKHGYSTQQVGIVYHYLMGDNARGRMFFEMNDDFHKIWVDDFFASIKPLKCRDYKKFFITIIIPLTLIFYSYLFNLILIFYDFIF